MNRPETPKSIIVWATTYLVLALSPVVLVLACTPGDGAVVASKLQPGDVDPNAPAGWPLAIGEPDFVSWSLPGSARDEFVFWEGNCCINWVNRVPYTAKWRTGVKDGKSWDFYEGHVPAEPIVLPAKVSRAESARLRLSQFEYEVNLVRKNDPETYSSQEYQDFLIKYRKIAEDRVSRAEAADAAEVEGR